MTLKGGKSIGRQSAVEIFRRVWETKGSLAPLPLAATQPAKKKKKPENVEINWLRDVYVYLML